MQKSRKRPLILVVEDDVHHRLLYGELLWYNGFDVVYAGDGEEGLRLAAEHLPDLVLLDLMLPKVDGLEVCRRLKRTPSTVAIPVVALSARPRVQAASEAREAGCVAYLEKPVSPVEVLHVVEDLVGLPPPPGAPGPQPG